MQARVSAARARLLAAGPGVRAVRAVPLRPHADHRGAELPGPRRRPDLSAARLSLHWFAQLAEGLGTVDIGAALRRSLGLGVVVMLLTVLLSVLAGLAFRKRLRGGQLLFFVTVASLIMPSIIVSLGIGLQFRLLDDGLKALLGWAPTPARRLWQLAGPHDLGPGRAPDLDAALRPADHVRGVQPLQPGL
jgi:ABC-type glycerol-3-phosphate transport system permease component